MKVLFGFLLTVFVFSCEQIKSSNDDKSQTNSRYSGAEECNFNVRLISINGRKELLAFNETYPEGTADSMIYISGEIKQNNIKIQAEVQTGKAIDRQDNNLNILQIKSWQLFDQKHSTPNGNIVYLRISDKEINKDKNFLKLHVIPEDIEYKLVKGSASGLYWEGDKLYEPTEKGYKALEKIITNNIIEQYSDIIDLNSINIISSIKENIKNMIWWDKYGSLIFELKTDTPLFIKIKGKMINNYCN